MGLACFVESLRKLYLPISLVLKGEMMGVPAGTGLVDECRVGDTVRRAAETDRREAEREEG